MLKKIVACLVLVALALFVADGILTAADAAPAAGAADPAAATGTAHSGGKTMLELFKATGWVGVLLLLLSITGFALVIEHIVNIKEEKVAPQELIQQLDEALEQGNTEQAYEICQSRDLYFSRIVKAGLEAGGVGEKAIDACHEVAQVEAFNLNTKISYLSLVGNVAPLVGLLGTVTGMISSFQEIEKKKAPTPADLATGVYESLVNTTMGLFAAVVFLTAYFLFKNKVAKMVFSANTSAALLLRDRTAA